MGVLSECLCLTETGHRATWACSGSRENLLAWTALVPSRFSLCPFTPFLCLPSTPPFSFPALTTFFFLTLSPESSGRTRSHDWGWWRRIIPVLFPLSKALLLCEHMFEPIVVHRPPAVLRAIQPNVILSPTLCFRRHKEGAPFPLFHRESTLSGTQGEGLSLQYKGYAWYSAFLLEQTMSL